jgi:hypothetical protein
MEITMNASAGKAKYQAYLQSVWWWERREQRLKVAGGQCEFRSEKHYDGKHVYLGNRCTETKRLDVHHKHYESLGAEKDEDLAVLCRKHHLVREVQKVECGCGESVVSDEAVAIDLVEMAIEERGGLKGLTLDMIDVPGDCDYHEHLFSKDD